WAQSGPLGPASVVEVIGLGFGGDPTGPGVEVLDFSEAEAEPVVDYSNCICDEGNAVSSAEVVNFSEAEVEPIIAEGVAQPGVEVINFSEAEAEPIVGPTVEVIDFSEAEAEPIVAEGSVPQSET